MSYFFAFIKQNKEKEKKSNTHTHTNTLDRVVAIVLPLMSGSTLYNIMFNYTNWQSALDGTVLPTSFSFRSIRDYVLIKY